MAKKATQKKKPSKKPIAKPKNTSKKQDLNRNNKHKNTVEVLDLLEEQVVQEEAISIENVSRETEIENVESNEEIKNGNTINKENETSKPKKKRSYNKKGNGKGFIKNTVWMYAIILFTSAFIVLLITAYSQIKFTKSTIETESNNKLKNSRNNLMTLVEENKKLSNDIQKVSIEKKEIQNTKNKILEELNGYKKNNAIVQEMYERVYQAYEDYLNDDFISSAKLISGDFKPELLKEEGFKKFEFLRNKTFFVATKELFLEGESKYNNGNFEGAIKSYKDSLFINKREGFSEDCYYKIAKSYHSIGNKEETKKAVDELLKEYPYGNFARQAKDLRK